ncbi:MAG: hypothetical protein UW76_C0049G0007 [Parcubacteria group bacterium GW2011_GWF2_44_8b]|nr:MAG: hypothetical protein UV94_C0012G0020 [Parcubacteria group bacterium GW2011_GWC1_43_30]KKT78773.1 MAG: hypothetical protein UW76_C0049G0007 [Parcubacteria group bacterium GW2011_GWF2_44_8b]KKT85451.1 MAG: hypothetical protein UW83_C0017G0002 [Parcubacteria group bacterium GW2011_GWD1_44_9]
MDKEKVLNLAKLARIEIGDKEAGSLSGEFKIILDYVSEVRGAGIKNKESGIKSKKEFLVRNVMREDAEPHESGLYTKQILEQAPAMEGGYLKVKKIL